MRLEQLSSLNVDELSMCLFIVNNVEPKILPYEISARLLCSIDDERLVCYINSMEPKINEYGIDVYNSLRYKLGIISLAPEKRNGYFFWDEGARFWQRKISNSNLVKSTTDKKPANEYVEDSSNSAEGVNEKRWLRRVLDDAIKSKKEWTKWPQCGEKV